jgi:hypothetical protein
MFRNRSAVQVAAMAKVVLQQLPSVVIHKGVPNTVGYVMKNTEEGSSST